MREVWRPREAEKEEKAKRLAKRKTK
jgi:hypothetical protein